MTPMLRNGLLSIVTLLAGCTGPVDDPVPHTPSPPAPIELHLESLNTSQNEISIAFSSDLTEAWVERRPGRWGAQDEMSTLLHYRRSSPDVPWTDPVPASFTRAEYDFGDPYYDDATRTLYFVTDTPVPDFPESAANIWMTRRSDHGWETPSPLPQPVNGPGAEYSPIPRGDRIYFASYRDGGGDLYVAERNGDSWRTERLPPTLNDPESGEWNLWVSEDEELIVFEASGRPTNVSVPGDLYASVRDEGGLWRSAVPLVSINGEGSDLNPVVVGDRLVYASSSVTKTHTDLYEVPLARVEEALRNQQ